MLGLGLAKQNTPYFSSACFHKSVVFGIMGLLIILLRSGHGCGEAGVKRCNQTQVEASEEQAAAVHGQRAEGAEH